MKNLKPGLRAVKRNFFCYCLKIVNLTLIMSQRQFLPLDEDSMDIEREFNLENMSAMDYLKQVRFERKTIPQVVTVHPMVNSGQAVHSEQKVKLIVKFASSSYCSLPFQTPADKTKPKIFNANDPTKEWRDIQKEKFSEMQQRIVEIRKDSSFESRLSKEIQLDTDEEEICITFFQQNEPVLSTILTFNQGQLEELIEILSSHFSENISSLEPETIESLSWITKWIYALLACLRSPLDPEVHSCLRMIAKSCIQVTEYLKTLPDTTGDSFLSWNLIIVVISLNFKQFDLLSL
jgi:gem associated protein 2